MADKVKTPGFIDAIPFWASLALVPVVVLAGMQGGWTIFLVPACTWALFSGLDAIIGDDRSNIDPETPDGRLFWYQLVTRVWVPVQAALLIWALAYVPSAAHLSGLEKFGVFFGVGVLTGTIGINYAHELMHQPGRLDRWLGDILLAMVLYSHFRSEHLLVHHRYVATPRDAVTARMGESFPRFFLRVLPECLVSAWAAERDRLARKGLPVWDRANPFWRYGGLQAGFLLIALLLGGWAGLALFAVQAFTAAWQLELVNYVEHYGLERKHLGGGRYEHVAPRHSWNATRKASNWLLINLQRHSDHHYKPARPFPLLQSGDPSDTPELPYGYPVMTTAAMIPPLWRRLMNPHVRRWRATYYPEITDWSRTRHRPEPR